MKYKYEKTLLISDFTECTYEILESVIHLLLKEMKENNNEEYYHFQIQTIPKGIRIRFGSK